MAFLSVTAPHATLSLAGHTGDTAIAYGDSDTITSASGLASGDGDGDGNTVYLVGADETFLSSTSFSGGHDKVAVYGDSDIAKVNNGSVTTFGHGDTVNIFGIGVPQYAFAEGNSSVAAMGDSSVFVTCTAGVMSFIGGTGFSVVLAGGADVTNVNFGQGGGVAVGGEMGGVVRGRAMEFEAQNTLAAGLKTSTLYGSNHGSNNMIASGAAGDGLVGGENSANVMDARTSSGNNYMEGHQGQYTAPTGPFMGATPSPSNIMLGGSGNDVMVAGSGTKEMHAGSGTDTFVVINSAINQVGGGNQVMLDAFKQGTDHLDLVGYAGSTDALLASASHDNGGTQMQIADGVRLNVAGVNLTANDIWRQG